MTVKELKEAIENYPDNYDVTIDCGPFMTLKRLILIGIIIK